MAASLLVVLAFVALFLTAVILSQRRAQARAEQEARERAERRRVEECGQVIRYFANHLGYVAREAISRGELDSLLERGLCATDLAAEMARRIQALPGIKIGYQVVEGSRVPVPLTAPYRERHVYVVGKSGSGKTNLLRTLILQDLQAGHGVGVIAPEQEMLTEEILPFVPESRIDDIIYVNPADTERPVYFNPLHLEAGEDLDLKVDENLTIFRRALGEPGPRMEEILRRALYALIERPGSTLLDIARLLDPTSPALREEIAATTPDPDTAHWWRTVYPTFPKDAHLPVTNRLARFLHPKSIRNLLCQPGPGLNFGEAMDAGKVLLFNLSDGLLGEQNSQLLGQLIVSRLQLATMARARQSAQERRPFYLYIDEFQAFTGVSATSYEKILSRARKYRLSLTLAHQQTGQLPAGLLKEILGNVSTTICFLVSREDALRFSQELVTSYDGEIIHVPEEAILQLRVGEAWCKVGPHAFRLYTYLAPQRHSPARAQFIIERARDNYGRDSEQRQLPLPARQTVPAGSGKSQNILDDLDPSDVFGA